MKYLTKPCMVVFTDADSLDLIVTLRLRCMTIGLRESSLCYGVLKVVTNSFPKNTLQVYKYIKRTEVS